MAGSPGGSTVGAGMLHAPTDGWVDPEVAFLALYATAENAFWLDRGVSATSGVSLMGQACRCESVAGSDTAGSDTAGCVVTADVGAGTVTVGDPGGAAVSRVETIFEFLERVCAHPAGAAAGGDDAAFAPGWVGWLGYECGAHAAGAPVFRSRTPDAALLFCDRAVSFDHAARRVSLSAADAPGARRWIAQTRAVLAACANATGATHPALLPGNGEPADASEPLRAETGMRWRHGPAEYLRLIGRAQDSIARGDAYQLCLTNELRVDGAIDPVAAYLRLRRASPAPTGGYLRIAGVSVLSATPERFLTITRQGTITTRPIKGTRPRGVDAAADALLLEQLRTSEKERAENLMIVDLMRNDLARVARVGSVHVRDLLVVESYAQVHQLVSTVQARLSPGVSGIAALQAAFPAGSMTGAPKLSAMRILHELEQGPRGAYAGCFGVFGLDGRVDLRMLIRSIVADTTGVSIGAGGGITALSDPAEELAEVQLKADVAARIVRHMIKGG